MLNRLMQVIRVYLTRPWVWLMGAVALFQLFPAYMVTRGGSGQSIVSLLPAVEPRKPAVRRYEEFFELAEQGKLGEAKSIDLVDRVGMFIPAVPFRVTRDAAGTRTIELADPKDIIQNPFDDLGILSHLRKVTDLRADLHMFSTTSLRRLGALSKLEFLSLRNAGSSDSAALKEVGAELPQALGKLTALKKLDLQNAFGMAARIPPLPNLEFLAIGPTLHLEESLQTVAEHSPRLSTLVLVGYPQETLTPGVRDALRKMPQLRAIYLEGFADTAATRAQLRADLPAVAFPRSTYLPGRVYGSLYLLLGMMFPHMILWMQSIVCFSLPIAHTLPGFRKAHLAVPLFGSLVLMSAAIGVALWLGLSPLPAMAVILTAAAVSMSPQPVIDLTPRGTWILRLLIAWRIGVLAAFLLLTFRGQPTFDAFVRGEFPRVAILLLVVEIAACCRVILRLVRQARVLAEIGQPLIPGMVNLDQFSMQPMAVFSRNAPGRTDPVDHWPDRCLERLISGPRRSLAALLRGGNAGVIWQVRAVILAALVVALTLIFRPQLPGSLTDQLQQSLPIAAIQGGVLFIGWTYMRWIGRRQVLAYELIRPVSRSEYYSGLWKATSYELAQVMAFLFAVAAVLLAVRRTGSVPWAALILGTAGLFLFLHGFLIWLLTARRIWVPLVAGFAMLTVVFPLCGVLLAANFSSAGTAGDKTSHAVLLGIPLLAIVVGVALQIWQRRRWETLELG